MVLRTPYTEGDRGIGGDKDGEHMYKEHFYININFVYMKLELQLDICLYHDIVDGNNIFIL